MSKSEAMVKAIDIHRSLSEAGGGSHAKQVIELLCRVCGLEVLNLLGMENFQRDVSAETTPRTIADVTTILREAQSVVAMLPKGSHIEVIEALAWLSGITTARREKVFSPVQGNLLEEVGIDPKLIKKLIKHQVKQLEELDESDKWKGDEGE